MNVMVTVVSVMVVDVAVVVVDVSVVLTPGFTVWFTACAPGCGPTGLNGVSTAGELTMFVILEPAFV